MKPFRIIFHYARNYIIPLTVTVIAMLLLVAVQLVIPWIIKVLIASVTDPSTVQNSGQLINNLTLDRKSVV